MSLMSMSKGEAAAVPDLQERYRAEILREAAAICRGELATDPTPLPKRQAELLHLLGLLMTKNASAGAGASGSTDFAVACLTRAATLAADNATYITDLGDILTRRGRSAEAVGILLRAAALAATDVRAWRGLGRALAQQRRWDEAVLVYEEALRLDPAHARTHIELGDARRSRSGGHAAVAWGEAFSHYQRAVSLDPEDAEAHRRLGQAHLARAAWAAALDAFRRGLALRPRDVELTTDIADTLLRSGSIVEAVQTLRDALNIAPKHVRACQLLACALELLGRRAEATEAWLGLGVALDAHDQLEDAAATYRKVIARKPECVRALNKLGWVLLKLAKPEEAVRCFESVLALDSGHEAVHRRLGCAALMANDEPRGWQEWGWNNGLRGQRRFEQPMWDGAPLHGRTILVWAEFALGDTLQCLRYLPLLKDLGARVVVECQATLLPLVQRMPCVDQAVASNAPLPPFDVHAPLFSLPGAFQTSRLGAGVPYLTVGEDIIAAWRERLRASEGSGHGHAPRATRKASPIRTIGIAWSGSPTGSNARFRFTTLSSFAPLADVPDVRFISLQLGPRAIDLLAPPPGLRVETLLNETCTGADTAALMMNLDLIITIDSMVAHLAGALARPVWTVTWLAPAWWLWQNDGDRSLWYPTMRLFQQKRTGDWADVFARVRAELETAAHPPLQSSS
jgi:tetratricopeptide (TPR) repeat protein